MAEILVGVTVCSQEVPSAIITTLVSSDRTPIKEFQLDAYTLFKHREIDPILVGTGLSKGACGSRAPMDELALRKVDEAGHCANSETRINFSI